VQLTRYARWLHTGWPAGAVEKLPAVGPDGSTPVRGLYVTGDLTGISLLKFASDSGARAVRAILDDPDFAARERASRPDNAPLDLIIVGAGVSGMAAALAARNAGLNFLVLEGAQPFATVADFPRAKPIFTYPSAMTPRGELQFGPRSAIKEGLLEELREATLGSGIAPRTGTVASVRREGSVLKVRLEEGEVLESRNVILALGRSGAFRRLGVSGEDLDKVHNRLHDPRDFRGKRVLVVGGGDSALETAIAIVSSGGEVTLSYLGSAFGRPKPGNIAALRMLEADPAAEVTIVQPESERVSTATGEYLGASPVVGKLRVAPGTLVTRIAPNEVELTHDDGRVETLPNDVVFSMIGRDPPLDLLRRCGVPIKGDWSAAKWIGLAVFLAFCAMLFNWKADGALSDLFYERGWFPYNLPWLMDQIGGAIAASSRDSATLLGTLRIGMFDPVFHFSALYSFIVVVFGMRRIRKRKTPYITAQTVTLMLIQVFPLFLLPCIMLPWAGHNGWFDAGVMKTAADALFPAVEWGHGREYWRAAGFILAWPLFIWNVFTQQPLWTWLAISVAQTFVLIPIIIHVWGKGAYCGWICSCGALAETLGDEHRHKMPHGSRWNRLNMVGQAILAIALLLLALRVASWIAPGTVAGRAAEAIYAGMLSTWQPLGIRLSYKWTVDIFLSGILGIGTYFWLSGRVWCRFACPLAALMNIYARFSRFRILAEKAKCISCNMCTSSCHQGIDVMSFANKGLPMADPQCVRCGACVQECPTGTLRFGRIDPKTGATTHVDRLAASPVLMAERKTMTS